MRPSFKKFFLLSFFLLSPLKADFDQYWLKGAAGIPLSPQNYLSVSSSHRWKTKTNRLFQRYVKIALDHEISPDFILTIAYRHDSKYLSINDAPPSWKDGARPMIDIIRIYHLAILPIEQRNRFEYKTIEKTWVYRIRFKGEVPIPSPFGVIHPFISQEIFVEKLKSYNENRVEVGSTIPFFLGIEGRVSYLKKYKKKESNWDRSNILKLQLSLYF